MQNKLLDELKIEIRDLVNMYDSLDAEIQDGGTDLKYYEDKIKELEAKVRKLTAQIKKADLKEHLLNWSKEISKNYTGSRDKKVANDFYFQIWQKCLREEKTNGR